MIRLLIDSHCHFHLGPGGWQAFLHRMPTLSAARFGVASTCPDDWQDILQLYQHTSKTSSSKTQTVMPAFGLHPWWAHKTPSMDSEGTGTGAGIGTGNLCEQLEAMLIQVPSAIVGEIGLDRLSARREAKRVQKASPIPSSSSSSSSASSAAETSTSSSSSSTTEGATSVSGGEGEGEGDWRGIYAIQQQAFTAQLKVAAAMRRPVVVHCVQAFGDLLTILKETRDRGKDRDRDRDGGMLMLMPTKIYMHSYSGSIDTARSLMALCAGSCPVYFGFSACCNLHSNSSKTESVIAAIPDDRLLLETDLEESEGADRALQSMLAVIAAAKGWGISHAAATTTANAERFYDMEQS